MERAEALFYAESIGAVMDGMRDAMIFTGILILVAIVGGVVHGLWVERRKGK